MRQQKRQQTWMKNPLYWQLLRMNESGLSRTFRISAYISFIIVIGMVSLSCSVFIGGTWEEPSSGMVSVSYGGIIPLPMGRSGSLLGRPTGEVEVGRIFADGMTQFSVNGALILPPPFSDDAHEGPWWALYMIGGPGWVGGQFTPNSGFGFVVKLGECLCVRSDYRYYFHDDTPFNRAALVVWFLPIYCRATS